MALYLHKDSVTDEGETFWIVKCRINGGSSETLKERYSFAGTETDANMETAIINDLTAKGYSGLSPVEWE